MWLDGKDTKAIMKQMANNVSQVISSSSRNHGLSLIDAEMSLHNREPVAAGPSNMVLISRSIHESCYPVRRSAPGNSNLVLPSQSFRRVEVQWLTFVDPWEAYVV